MTDPTPKAPHGLSRNAANYGDRDFAFYLRRSFAASMGYSRKMLEKPVVGIADTASDYNNCHRNVPEMIEAVPITPQVPALVASLPSISPIRSAETSPAR